MNALALMIEQEFHWRAMLDLRALLISRVTMVGHVRPVLVLLNGRRSLVVPMPDRAGRRMARQTGKTDRQGRTNNQALSSKESVKRSVLRRTFSVVKR